MHRLILITLAIVLVFMAGTAGAEELKVDLDIGVGYRTDKLDWDVIPLTNGVINGVYSGAKWDDTNTIYAKVGVRISKNKFHARGSLGYGRTIDGYYRETFFSDPAHLVETDRLAANIDGYVFDASIGLGYHLGSDKAPITPLIGYSWNLQHFQADSGIQNGTSPITAFKLTNESRWQGPWIGLDFSFQPSDKARLYATAEYHFGDYRAQARSSIASSDNVADAEGFVLTAGLSIKLKDSWDIGLEAQYTQWTSDVGTHGSDILNEANWESLYGTFNVTHRFYQLNGYNRLSSL